MQASAQPKTEVAPTPQAEVVTSPPSAQSPFAITTPGPDGKPQTLAIPKTQEEVNALLEQRQEMSNQLSNVTNRRSQLVQEIRTAPEGPARTGIEERVTLLDQRILKLETDIGRVGLQLSAAPGGLITSYSTSSSGGDDFEEGFAAGGFSLIGVAFLVFLWRRRPWRKNKKKATAMSRDLPSDSAQRLERLEQGMDAIAVEIERVSEGQRFVTRLLSEAHEPVGARTKT